MPPQTFGKCFFFCNEFRKISRSGGNVNKMFPNEGDLSDRDLLLPEKYYPPTESGQPAEIMEKWPPQTKILATPLC